MSIYLETITGGMGAGKSEHAIALAQRYSYNKKVFVVTLVHINEHLRQSLPENRNIIINTVDKTGYIQGTLSSRSNYQINSYYILSFEKIRELIDSADVLIIDEFQFFDESSVQWLANYIKTGGRIDGSMEKRERNLHIYIHGIVADVKRDKLGHWDKIFHLVTSDTKFLNATCAFCGRLEGKISFSIEENNEAIRGKFDTKKDQYECACLDCHSKYVNTPTGLITKEGKDHLRITQEQ